MSDSSALFWVYENWTVKRARLHRADCVFCQHGRGLQGTGNTATWQWLPFDSYEEARACPAMSREDAGECAQCMR